MQNAAIDNADLRTDQRVNCGPGLQVWSAGPHFTRASNLVLVNLVAEQSVQYYLTPGGKGHSASQ